MENKAILVVDDEEDVVRVLSKRLLAYGYKVLAASDGLQAIEKARERPDLILLDITMRDMDGLEVLRQIKGASETSEIPVIMVTGKCGSSSILDAQDLGAADYITKPFELENLLALVKRHTI